MNILHCQSLKRTSEMTPATALKVCSARQANAAGYTGIQIVSADFLPHTRSWPAQANGTHFQFAICYGTHKNLDLLLAEVDAAHASGAKSVYCVSHPRVIEAIAVRNVPVFAHAGLVPQICTGVGGLRAVGTTPIEAQRVRDTIRAFEEAGAVGAYLQLLPRELAAEITKTSPLITISVGSGGGCDVIWAHAEDVLGQNLSHVPRHAKVYAGPDRTTDADCFRAFRQEVENQEYPSAVHEIRKMT